MIWSKLKKSVEALFAPELQGRVQLRSTNYRHSHDDVGRGSITVDGQEVWSMDSFKFWAEERKRIAEAAAALNAYGTEAQREVRSALDRDGILGQDSYYESLETYLNSSIEDNVASENVLRRALAMIDRRVGARRQAEVNAETEHPMVQYFWGLRKEAQSRGGLAG